ncbi:MAG: ABC transporter permease [Dehalococcoidia bacterium]
MTRYLISRLLQTVVMLFFVALITFTLMHLVTGGPFDSRAGDRGASPSFIASQEAYYGLDDPIPVQFVRYLGNLAKGDLGLSFAHPGQRVSDRLKDGIKPSFLLGGMAFTIMIVVSIPLGIIAAIRANSRFDYISLGLSTIFAAVPSFVLAFMMLLIFAVWLDVVDVRLGLGFGDSISSLPNGILPAVALCAPATALLTRLTRGSMLEVLSMDYVRTARAKGLSENTVYVRHAFRNAMIPVVTLLPPAFAGLITGSIIIESIFGLPGIGTAFVTSVFQRDYGIIMGTTLFYAFLIAMANLAADFTYPFVDPRVKIAG